MQAEGAERGYRPIEDYGLIGNMHTVALVAKADASIDFFSFPQFDSPLLFGRLLSAHNGGHFQISPLTPPPSILPSGLSLGADEQTWRSKQLYYPSSNVLLTRFNTPSGIGQVTDLLPVSRETTATTTPDPDQPGERAWPWIVRMVEVVRGTVEFVVTCQPAFDYGRLGHSVRIISKDRILFEVKGGQVPSMELLVLVESEEPSSSSSSIHWDLMPNHTVIPSSGAILSQPAVRTAFTLSQSDPRRIFFVLREAQAQASIERIGIECLNPSAGFLMGLVEATNAYWHWWISKCVYRGRWREMVHRSALVLKLLTHLPTGAIIAAPTTSLPEDAAFTVYAFLRIGFKDEARAFMRWIERVATRMNPETGGLHILYTLDGQVPRETVRDAEPSISATTTTTTSREWSHERAAEAYEVHLEHWEGYRGSRPVRIGNAAFGQSQLDIYGELLDAVYLCDKHCEPISHGFWVILRDRIVPYLIRSRRWASPDHGVWEGRGVPRNHVYSRVMCWVALDRAIRLALKRSLPAPDLAQWIEERDAIKEEVIRCGWNQELGSFVQAYGSSVVDASNLIMPLVFFLSPCDPLFLATLRRTLEPPERGGLTVNHLVFRYLLSRGDAAIPESSSSSAADVVVEGTFTICSFWLVEALARAGGLDHPRMLAQATIIFEDILGYANHLGLYSEEIDLSGRALGNFPQAFTHLSLISAAFNLDRQLG